MKTVSPSLIRKEFLPEVFVTWIVSLLSQNSIKECIAEEFATAEARIIDTILHGYNSDIRPSINGTGSPVQVKILKFWEQNPATFRTGGRIYRR